MEGGGHFNRECCLYQETGELMTHSGECRTNHVVSLSGNMPVDGVASIGILPDRDTT